MTTWTDKSDSKSRFFDGGEAEGHTTREAIDKLFACLRRDVLGKGNSAEFDLILFEVNCDTGRLLVAATTREGYLKGLVDGCSLRVQEVQDFWYDLLEKGLSHEQFSAGVGRHVRHLAMLLRERLVPCLDELKHSCASAGFTYRVFGSDPGTALYEEEFHIA